MQVAGYRSDAPDVALERVTFTRRALRPDDVAVTITFCGVCHTDLHALHAPLEQGGTFPLVPGHEFVGTVTAIGEQVTAFRIGDPVAVGNIVDSCGVCSMCLAGQENFCLDFPTLTYAGIDRVDRTTTMGAFSNGYVVRDQFVYHRPENLDPAGVAPLMCAGITVWEPLRRWNVGSGMRVGVVGLGGLGHLAVKFAVALGAEVSVITTSAHKADGARALGATDVVLSSDDQAMNDHANQFDFVLDTVSAPHDLAPYLRCVALDGTLCSVGYLGPIRLDTMSLLIGRKSLASAGSGGRRHTQEMLDFCGQHGLIADVEVLPSAQVQTALDRLSRNDVRYRFSLDMSDL
jgi:alcohol dehydrogenase (NADP+)